MFTIFKMDAEGEIAEVTPLGWALYVFFLTFLSIVSLCFLALAAWFVFFTVNPMPWHMWALVLIPKLFIAAYAGYVPVRELVRWCRWRRSHIM